MDELIRNDRVGLYGLNTGYEKAISRIPLPFNAPEYGNLVLSRSGAIQYQPVKSYNNPWETRVAAVTVHAVPWSEAMSCFQGMSPKRLLKFEVEGRQYIVLFTGITAFVGGLGKAVAHVPGVHHAGTFAVGLKSSYDNRGSSRRAVEARDFWWSVVNGKIDLSSAPSLSPS